MTLQEMSVDYRSQAQALGGRIRDLRELEKQATSPLEQEELNSRIRVLSVLWRENRELAEHLAHYYERGYPRNEKYTL